MKLVYLSLGSNVGDRLAHLQAAIERLASDRLRILRQSPVYETEPLEFAAQGWFLNLVVEAETDLFPVQLLHWTGAIERKLGRRRTIPSGPRIIDIDILLYANSRVRRADLEIPHPKMAERRFVLAPLADLAPGLRHPITGRTVAQMLEAAPPEALKPFV